MKSNRIVLLGTGIALLLINGSSVEGASKKPTSFTSLHIHKTVRVDGSSDLRGRVRARSGLNVTAGLRTDTFDASGPVSLDGILNVAGLATTSGLNAGSGAIATTGGVQGGSLSIAGDTNLGGALQVAKGLSAASLSAATSNIGGQLNAGSINTDGPLAAGSITSGGSVTGSAFTTSGTITGGTANFTHLSVSSGGTVNFNNASLTGVSGAALSGNVSVNSLQITTSSAGGTTGTQALTLTQNGQTASLSVGSSGLLAVAGTGLSAASLAVTNNASVGGALTVSRIESASQLTLAPATVAVNGLLDLTPSANLQLDSNGSDKAAHMVGNQDTRGVCPGVSTGSAVDNTCSVTFIHAYAASPVVVVTPSGATSSFVTDFSVVTSPGGFVIHFRTTGAGSANFNYIVEG